MSKPSPTDAELKDNAQQLAWLALGFFQALLKGDAVIEVEQIPSHDGSLVRTRTIISVDWDGKSQEETV